MFRSRFTLWIVVLGCVSTGCTLVGAGIGAVVDSAIPGPYEDHSDVQRVFITQGDRVRLGLRNGKRMEGKYVGAHGPTVTNPERYLVIERDDSAALVPVSDLRTIGTETTGKGWLYGGLIGLAIDVTVVVATIIAFNDMELDMHGLGGNSGCFC